MNGSHRGETEIDRIDREAAAWIWRVDRGLTLSEQDEFFQWSNADPRHGASLSHYRRNWSRLDQLVQLKGPRNSLPDPDLLAPPPKRIPWVLSFSFAAAAAITVAFYIRWPRAAVPIHASAMVPITEIEERTLEDGSTIQLNRGAEVTVNFTPGERHMRLERGEAHFKVAKNPARPFIVDAGGVRVRAVGTAFDIDLGAADVDVLVTEGRVQVNAPASEAGVARPAPAPTPVPVVEAGQRAIVSLSPTGPPPQVAAISAAEIERLLSWQPRLFDYTATPLSEIVAAFNRRNFVRLTIPDPDLAALRISVCFRSDNIEGFVRLLEASFGVRAERHGAAEIVLRKVR